MVSFKAIATCIQGIELCQGYSRPGGPGGLSGSVVMILDRVFVERGFRWGLKGSSSGIREQS